jgi:hypothetical protein
VRYAARRLTHHTNAGIASRSLPSLSPSPFIGAQVGLVVTQCADVGVAPVAHNIPVGVGSVEDVACN